MKKNLQKVLVLALGLVTTIASAQWSANSTSRIDNDDSDNRSVTNRIAVSADFGAVHVSSDVTANSNGDATGFDIYEAYATTDLMGFATLTIGRQDLSFGSGALMSSNDWGLTRYTSDGYSLGMNLGGFDVNLGSLGGVNYSDENYMNASGNFGGADVNILMMNRMNAAGESQKAHGYDMSYSMNNFTVSASMNSDYEGDEMTAYGITYNVSDNLSASFGKTSYGEGTMLSPAIAAVTEVLEVLQVDEVLEVLEVIGVDEVLAHDSTFSWNWHVDSNGNGFSSLDYNNDYAEAVAGVDAVAYVAPVAAVAGVAGVAGVDAAESVHSSFNMGNTALSGGWSNGNMGYLGNNDEMTSIGISYDLGDITLSYTMHTVSNDDLGQDGEDLTPEDREASTMSLSYQLNDNCNISMSRFSDSDFDLGTEENDGEWNYITISIGL